MNRDSQDLQDLLDASSRGDAAAKDMLFALISDELILLARSTKRKWGRGAQSLTTVGLVSELYLRMVKTSSWKGRRAFFCYAATTVQNLLVDYTKRKKAQKRGGGKKPLELRDAVASRQLPVEDVAVVADALDRLEAEDERAAQVARLRWMIGFTIQETAEILEVSESTVKEDWHFSKSWLGRELSELN